MEQMKREIAGINRKGKANTIEKEKRGRLLKKGGSAGKKGVEGVANKKKKYLEAAKREDRLVPSKEDACLVPFQWKTRVFMLTKMYTNIFQSQASFRSIERNSFE